MVRCNQRTALRWDEGLLRRCVVAVFVFVGLTVAGLPALAQQAPVPEVSFPVEVQTDAVSGGQALTLGYDPNATDNTEDGFDELAPPPPPATAFDGRLVNENRALLGDIRNGASSFGGTETHQISFQTRDEATEVTISWNLPDGVTGTIEDEFGGESYGPKDMTGEGSITVSPDDPDAIVTIDYSGNQPSINIQSAFVIESGTVSFRNTGAKMDFAAVDAPGEVTLTKFRNGPDGTGGISESTVSAYRYVVESDGLSFSGDATLRLADSTLAGMNNPTTVKVYRRDPPGSGSFESVVNTEEGDSEVRATTSGFGEFVLASNDSGNPLPVELTRFTVRGDEGAALLRWRTATETNNAGFEVQHRSPDADGYTEVGYVESKADGGTTAQPTSYRYEIPDLAPGSHRFRLRQLDTDGTGHLTEAVSFTVGMDRPLRLLGPSPNPVRAGATLRFGVQNPGTATVVLYNVLGQRIATLYEGTPPSEEMQTIRLDSQTLAGGSSGMYFVRLEANGASTTRRVTIAR